MKMLAYHNDPQLKQQILEQLQGSNLNLSITEYENRLGIPEVLVYLNAAIFDGLPNDLSKDWPIPFMAAINVGADLSTIWRDFVIWLLVDPVDGVIQYTPPGTEAHDAILQVAILYRDGYTEQQMLNASIAALNVAVPHASSYNAAAICAGYAASAVIADLARAASDVNHVVDYTAWAASAAVEIPHCYTASDAAYIKISNKLIELLEKQEVNHVSLP